MVVAKQCAAESVALQVRPHREERQVLVRGGGVVSGEQFVQMVEAWGGLAAGGGETLPVGHRFGQWGVVVWEPHRYGGAVEGDVHLSVG